MSDAYWISPRGQVLAVDDRHINSIIQNPKQFGLTTDYLKSVYKKYKEPFSGYREGKAREEIMLSLIKGGWIRARQSLNAWTVQTWMLNNKSKDNIWGFVFALIKKGTLTKNSQLNIHDIKDNDVLSSSVSELKDKLLEHKKKSKRIKLKELLRRSYEPTIEYNKGARR